MYYLITFFFLLISMLVYFKIADHFNIIDKPNQRSSHTEITIRGGGVVVPLAAIAYAILFHNVSLYVVGGIVLISAISLADDVSSLSNKVRLLVQLLSVTMILYGLGALETWPWWIIVLSCVLILGVINAYNFMDGINGITGLYSLIVLLSIWYVNVYVYTFTDSAFIILPILSCLVFLFFNFRKKARCFAGDVGSVALGCWIATLLLSLVLYSNDLKYLLILAVYGCDTVLTIVHRLILKQNIFEAHRLHFYQVLANEQKVSHLMVSIGYSILQVAINIMLVNTHWNFITTLFVSCLPLVLIYVSMKPKLMTKTIAV
ncbi:glycosyltransferase family 4 protein [Chitinophaga sp. Cy-1792]|uniref:MraY family glycosyltransferase n=1 Tax=Chitinophaga sp. Cy-1792 TaxID=2608339 RepID=UPI00141F01F2|nr:glycosyltransferase family 4 protein [Chitinophaga sp. Cy-1792]NIG55230.1 glycosyltransferase family 4 protein [Chitinophaga sp. Cy-1792]